MAKLLSAFELQVNGIRAQALHQVEGESLGWLEAWRGAHSPTPRCALPSPAPTEVPKSPKELSLSTLTQSTALLGSVGEPLQVSPAFAPAVLPACNASAHLFAWADGICSLTHSTKMGWMLTVRQAESYAQG